MSKQIFGPAGATSSIMQWQTTVFNADQESYVTIPTIDLTMDDSVAVACRLTPGGSTYTAYWWRISFPVPTPDNTRLLPLLGVGGPGSTATGELAMSCIVNDVFIRQEVTFAEVQSGDRIWINAQGSTITGYHDHAGAGFVPVISWTDSTIAGAGKVGLYWEGHLMPSVDFGGGNI